MQNEIINETSIRSIRTRLTTMSLLSVIILTFVASVLMVPLMFSSGLADLGIFPALLVTIAAEVITIFLAVWVVSGLKDWKNLLLFKNFTWKSLFLGAGIGIVLFILLQVISGVLGSLGVTVESSETSVSLSSLNGWQGFLTLAILTPIIVPILEEVFFRGYVLNFMRNGLGSKKQRVVWSVIISSFYFAIMHFQGFNTADDIVLLIWIGAIALINALLVIKYDSLTPAIGVHVAYNGVTSLAMAVVPLLV